MSEKRYTKPYNLLLLSPAAAEEYDTVCKYGIGKEGEIKHWFISESEREKYIRENNLEDLVNRTHQYKY